MCFIEKKIPNITPPPHGLLWGGGVTSIIPLYWIISRQYSHKKKQPLIHMLLA